MDWVAICFTSVRYWLKARCNGITLYPRMPHRYSSCGDVEMASSPSSPSSSDARSLGFEPVAHRNSRGGLVGMGGPGEVGELVLGEQ